MIYSDQDIRLALESGAISIEPRPAPASGTVRLVAILV